MHKIFFIWNHIFMNNMFLITKPVLKKKTKNHQNGFLYIHLFLVCFVFAKLSYYTAVSLFLFVSLSSFIYTRLFNIRFVLFTIVQPFAYPTLFYVKSKSKRSEFQAWFIKAIIGLISIDWVIICSSSFVA